MTDVYLFGINAVSKIISFYLENDERYNLLGFTVNRQYLDADNFSGYPVIPAEDLKQRINSFGIINAVGFSQQLSAREQVGLWIKERKLTLISYIHPTATIGGVDIGIGSIAMPSANIETYSKTGEGNVFYSRSHIGHDANIGNYNWFGAGCVVAGSVTFGNRNFIGINSSIREYTVIGSRATTGAGAVILKNIPDDVVVVGNPARTLVKK
ncbi:MAG: acetyltransferase [Defluviitaleaceae bacterium]|nr:acetyltransferase [Defluviitaleaceae bacterium]